MTQNNTQTDLCTCGHAQEHHFNGQCLELAARTRLCPCTQYQSPNATAATIAGLQARIRELEIQQDSAISTFHEIEQALGRALHYPRYSDDQQNFPGATDADGVCVGEHVPETLAAEAAQRIATLEAEAKAATRFLANESLVRENDALKQRVAELERDYKHKCEAKDCYYDCVEKKSANREIAEAQEQAWKVVRPFVAEKDATIAVQQQRIAELEREAARRTELLHDLAYYQLRVDNRLDPQYERGWCEAVQHITQSARDYLIGRGYGPEYLADEIERLEAELEKCRTKEHLPGCCA